MVDPAQITLLLALGLLAARRGVQAGRLLVLGVPAIALLASTFIRVADWLSVAEIFILSGACLTGILVAWDRHPGLWILFALTGVAGGALGVLNGAELARESWLVPTLYLSGAALGVGFLLMLCFALARKLLALGSWTDIAVRVGGSWCLAASSLLLVLALQGA